MSVCLLNVLIFEATTQRACNNKIQLSLDGFETEIWVMKEYSIDHILEYYFLKRIQSNYIKVEKLDIK